ncbi:hypothetical protein EVAR_93542_1 [Eumeta japonica]|uniref:Uncharacterized protein n=1 Tax=Eumeta variegata TaxID=151549 RepID=A0A4C1UR25_EUMVA|nr:hypothetical protein EVAR_93542_1 [Eumeta japonica]
MSLSRDRAGSSASRTRTGVRARAAVTAWPAGMRLDARCSLIATRIVYVVCCEIGRGFYPSQPQRRYQDIVDLLDKNRIYDGEEIDDGEIDSGAFRYEADEPSPLTVCCTFWVECTLRYAGSAAGERFSNVGARRRSGSDLGGLPHWARPNFDFLRSSRLSRINGVGVVCDLFDLFVNAGCRFINDFTS